MAISTKCLVDQITNCIVDSGLSAQEVAALSVAKCEIESSVYNVAALSDLPAAGCNAGRLVWVDALKDYRYSDGLTWSNNFSSTLVAESALIWTWGSNGQGRLGDGTTVNKSSPVSVVGGFSDWCQVSTGSDHTAAVRQNGTLWTWGSNICGILGDGTTVNKSSPVSVVGGFADWCQVSAGQCHTAAVRQNGTLWTWGNGALGRLGDNTTNIAQSSPVSVVGGFTDWCQVSVGYNHAAAVRQNGTLWAWGSNGSGRLGDGTTVSKSSPVSVVGGFTDWCQVSAGCVHTAAVRQNGTLWAWGCNNNGQLGDGTVFTKSSPVSVLGGFTDWCQVGVGLCFTTAVRQNGTLWAWGNNAQGRLGIGCTSSTSSPSSVISGFTDWCQVNPGQFHGVAIRQNGTLWAWGNNASGQLGDYFTIAIGGQSSPVSVVGGFTDWCQVSGGTNHTAAVHARRKGF
jgi:alpha-tubulin suppressor-like RCC1 family protein